jgi:hypothetical protein
MTSDDGQLRQRMRDGRLEQIREHVDRVERELDQIMELVTRLQTEDDSTSPSDVRSMQLPRDRSVTSACWPSVPLQGPVQEDSASL